MRKHILALLGGAAIAGLASASASAMPLAPVTVAQDDGLTQNVRLVCDDFGRCYRTGPRHRYVQRHYVAPDYYDYGPTVSVGPAYTYAPSYAWGGPSVGFSFGVGPRW